MKFRKKNFSAQRCPPVCLGKIKFRKERTAYAPKLCARMSQENKIPQKRTLFDNAVRPCVSGKQSSGKNFIAQRCAPVCLRKTKFRKKLYCPTLCARVLRKMKLRNKELYSPTLRALVSQKAKDPEKTFFANAARPCVSGKLSSGDNKLPSPTL